MITKILYCRWPIFQKHHSVTVFRSKLKMSHIRSKYIFLKNLFIVNFLKVLSRDSVTVTVDAVVYYRVSNPTMATNNVEDFR